MLLKLAHNDTNTSAVLFYGMGHLERQPMEWKTDHGGLK